MHSTDQLLLHLSLINGVGASTIHNLFNRCNEQSIAFHQLYDFTIRDFCNLGVSLPRAELIVHGLMCTVAVDKELKLCAENDIGIITLQDESYPAYLKAIHTPPPVLYFQGAPLCSDELCMAVIGSRRCSYYGANVIQKFVPALVESGWTIVSGGAIGADSIAHERTLDAGGRTIAVLGAGLLKPYPHSNKKLFNRILRSAGTLISSFPLTMEAMPGNFPVRNRIISGLSRGCLVAQAAEKSGTHITAQFALEQGRELFAVPGQIDDPLSTGCHNLIQQGAKLVYSPQDIFEEFDLASGRIMQSAENVNAEHVADVPADRLDDVNAIIIHNCAKPVSLDELIEATGMPAQELYTKIFMLEVEARIRRHANGTYERC